MPDHPHRIDFHHHYYTPEWYAYLTEHYEKSYKFPGLAILKRWSPAADVEAMDEGGVQTSLLSTCPPAVWFGDLPGAKRMARNMNDYGAELVRAYKARFGLFGVLPLPDVDSSLAEIAYVLDELKADGIGVLSSYDMRWLGDGHFAPIWEELNRRKCVVFVHAGTPTCCRETVPGLQAWMVEFNTDTARTIIHLIESGTAERYPGIRWVFSHAGGTIGALAGRFLGDQLATSVLNSAVPPSSRLGQLRTFYYDTAGSSNVVNMQLMKMLVPLSQFVFGTDYPWATPRFIADGLHDSGLTDAEIAGIDRRNALRLLPQFG